MHKLKSFWFKGKISFLFKGSYERDKKGERVFILTHPKRRITFESWQAAKKLGWVREDL